MSARQRTSFHLVGAVLLTLVGSLLIAPPASAAVPAAPSGLTPSGESVSGSPVLTWDRAARATSYNVQVAKDSDFTTVAYTTSTTNRRVVPNVQLAFGEVWWRVQSVGADGASDWSTTFFDRSALAGPTLISPASNVLLDQPEEPALLSWEPVEGATSYTIEIDDADDFIGAKTYTTKTSSYVVPDPQIATAYHWRVRANLATGIFTEWSENRTYEIGGLDKPVLTSPADTALQAIEDVVLDWEPVAGAAGYELQVSTDVNFNTLETSVTTKATRWSPPETLDNDQYFWRVRPVDTLGNKLSFDRVDTWQFRRHWPEQPELEYPIDSAVVSDPFFYQWTPVEKASRYLVQLSATSNFTSLVDQCTTAHTTYVPVKAGDCWPAAAGSYYWRVIAIDDYEDFDYPSYGPQTDSIAAQVEHFSYDPEVVDLASATPAPGATVQVPTLSWDAVPRAAKYRVYITAADGDTSVVSGVTTVGTSYTPRKQLTPGATYRWWVQTVSASGRSGATVVPESQSTFTVTEMPTASNALPTQTASTAGAEVTRFPTLTWSAVTGASYYRIALRKANGIAAFTELPEKFYYPAGEDIETVWTAPASYEWMVNAYRADGSKVSSSPFPQTLNFVPLPATGGARAAMTGTGTWHPETSCGAVLPDRCQDLRQTPVLRWDPVPGAGGYALYLSRDREMTNVMSGFPVVVDTTMWMNTRALIDSQAGEAFYWEVLPCVTTVGCRALDYAPWAFNKRSNPVKLASPAKDATVADDVTFEWDDYLLTNSDGEPSHIDGTGVASRVEAEQYVVEVSKDANFQSVLDSAVVDQTTYTAPTKTYPEGTLYWRVTPIDGSGNKIGATPGNGADAREGRTLIKSSPTPQIASPHGGATVSQTQPFRWFPRDFAASYDVEVYANNDTVGQTSNRVLSGNSKQVAFTTTTPLPVSDQVYRWRIRRVDASGNKGAWTELADPDATFRVVGTAPTLLSPTSGGTLVGNDTLFTWQAVDGATSYRFERRLVGSTSTAEVVTTPALAWAPTRTVADGSYEWRVSTLDAAGKVLKATGWRGFTVDGTPPTVTSYQPTGTVARTGVFVAGFSERVKAVSTSTVRIFEKGVPDPLAATVTPSSTGRKVTLDPTRDLKAGKVYTVQLGKQITDSAGNALAPFSWRVTAK